MLKRPAAKVKEEPEPTPIMKRPSVSKSPARKTRKRETSDGNDGGNIADATATDANLDHEEPEEEERTSDPEVAQEEAEEEKDIEVKRKPASAPTTPTPRKKPSTATGRGKPRKPTQRASSTLVLDTAFDDGWKLQKFVRNPGTKGAGGTYAKFTAPDGTTLWSLVKARDAGFVHDYNGQ